MKFWTRLALQDQHLNLGSLQPKRGSFLESAQLITRGPRFDQCWVVKDLCADTTHQASGFDESKVVAQRATGSEQQRPGQQDVKTWREKPSGSWVDSSCTNTNAQTAMHP